MIALRSPKRSAIAPNIGWPRAEFSLAIAIQNLAWGIGQPNSVAMGIWKTPKLARTAKDSMRMTQPANRTGVIRGDLVVVAVMMCVPLFGPGTCADGAAPSNGIL